MVNITRRSALQLAGATTLLSLTGCSSLLNDQCSPRKAPQWEIEGKNWSPPVNAENKILVSERYGATGTDTVSRIVCINANSGQAQWIYTVRNSGAGIPSVHNGTVYVGTGTDYIYSLNLETGHLRWQYDAGGNEEYGGGSWGTPAVFDGVVIAGVSHSERSDPDPTNNDAYTHRVVALNTADGTERWSQTIDAPTWTGPVKTTDTVVVATETGHVHHFDAATGAQRWVESLGGGIYVDPIVSDDNAYVATQNGAIAVFDLQSGNYDLLSDIPGNTRTQTATGEVILVGDEAGTVTAITRSNGTQKWQYTTDAAIADIAVNAGSTWILTQRGIVHQVESTNGSSLAQFRVSDNRYQDHCGWRPEANRAKGLITDTNAAYVTGPWIRKYEISE